MICIYFNKNGQKVFAKPLIENKSDCFKVGSDFSYTQNASVIDVFNIMKQP